MKQLITIFFFSLFVSFPLAGQVMPNGNPSTDNPGLQNFLESFSKLGQILGNDLKSLELSYTLGQFTTISNDYLHRLGNRTANIDWQSGPFNVQTQVVDYHLGPEAFLSRQEAQDIWSDAVSPFNPDFLLVGDHVGGANIFNNMPVLILRPKIGMFLNEQLLFDWD